MEIKLKQSEGCKKTFEVSAPWAEVEPRFAAVARTIRGQARVPGFRPGHVPESVLRSRFRKEIREEVLEQFLKDAAQTMVKDHGLKPVVEPYAAAIQLEEGEPFTCELAAEEAPEVPEADSKGVTIEIPKLAVQDEQVERALEGLRQRAAVMKPVEGPAQEGDYAVTTLQRKGQSKGMERFFAALPQSDHPAEKALMGRRPGDVVEVTVTEAAPGDDHEGHDHDDHDHESHGHDHSGHDHGHEGAERQHLAPGDYVITVNKVMRREVPDLNDDMAKDLGAENLASLRTKVRQDIEARLSADLGAMKEEKLLEALLAKTPFPVPPTLVERQLGHDLEELAEGLARQGVHPAKAGIDWDKMAESRRPIAERRVAGYYLMDAVAKRHGIEATEEDLKRYFEQKTAGTRVTAAQFRAHAEKEDQLDSVKTAIRHKKALDLLLSQASVTLAEGKSAAQEA